MYGGIGAIQVEDVDKSVCILTTLTPRWPQQSEYRRVRQFTHRKYRPTYREASAS